RVATVVDGFLHGLSSLTQRHPTPLAKAVDETIALEQARGTVGAVTPAGRARVATWVTQHFGSRGGTYCRHTPQLVATARVCQSLTKSQHLYWQTFHRLPDGVELEKASPAVQQERQTSVLVQHVLSGLGLSPLAFPALARR